MVDSSIVTAPGVPPAGIETLVSIGSAAVAPSPSVSVVVVEPAAPLPDAPSGAGTAFVRQAENSEFSGLAPVVVAVAVTTRPIASGDASSTLKLALPEPFVVTVVAVRNAWPSPLPDGSQDALSKSSMRNAVLDEDASVPATVVVPLKVVTAVSVGNVNPAEPGVTPSGARSIPRPPLSWMLLPRTAAVPFRGHPSRR